MAKPEIRLKGFEGDWVKSILGDLFKERVESDIHGEMLSVTMNKGIILASENGLYDNSNSDKSHYKLVKIGDIAYNSMRMWQGASGCSYFEGIVSPAYTVLKPNEGIYSPFFAILFKNNNIINTFRLHSQGLTSDTWNLKYPAFSKIAVYYPLPQEEQTAISVYFKSLDSMIQATTKKIESLKQMKQACLVSMFPQAGETTPRVRFKGFEGEWEDVSFKEISYLSGTKNRENLPLESYSISNEYGFIPQQEQFENGGTMAKADKKMYYIVTPDSFAYNPARINVGSIGYDDLDKDVIVSSLYVVFKTDANTHNPFLNYWFKTPMFKKMIELYQEGGVRLYFFYDKLCSCHFRRPSLKEQQRIASYFRSLDKQISMQEARLEKLKQIKAACLDKMFV